MDQLYLIIIGIFLLSLWASNNVQRSFVKYSKVPNDRGLSGAEAARILVQRNHLNVNVDRSSGGMLSDHYDPRTNTVHLLGEVHSICSRIIMIT